MTLEQLLDKYFEPDNWYTSESLIHMLASNGYRIIKVGDGRKDYQT